MCIRDSAKVALISGKILVAHHPAYTGLMRVGAGEERGASRAAAAGVVKLSEADAAVGKGVKVWGVNLTAVAADVAPAHVIGHDDDDVRLLGCL